jgi:adenylate kinase family enzyme
VQRVLVVGTSGCGKTTVAETIARHFDLPHVELDELFWKEGWGRSTDDEFCDKLERATAGDRWVVDGNFFYKLGGEMWRRADTVVWLDLPFPQILWRAAKRTVTQSLTRKRLWSGNRERLSHLWRKGFIMRWAIHSHPDNVARYNKAIDDPRNTHITFVRLKSSAEVRAWIEALTAASREAS